MIVCIYGHCDWTRRKSDNLRLYKGSKKRSILSLCFGIKLKNPQTRLNGVWTHPLLEAEVGRGAARVLAGQQPVRVAGTRRVGVGGRVGTGRAHGRRHVAVVVQHGAVGGVRGGGLRRRGVGAAQQRRRASVHRFIRPEETRRSETQDDDIIT